MKLGEMEKPIYNNKECEFSNSIYLGILRSVMVMAMAEREREREREWWDQLSCPAAPIPCLGKF